VTRADTTFRIALPAPPTGSRAPGTSIDIVDGSSTAVQRALRRGGLAGYEPATMAAMLTLFELQQPGFTFLDVGTNVGLYGLVCSALFEPGSVVGFEPTPETARIARLLAARNGFPIGLEQVALGAEPGTAQLYLSAKSDSSNSLAHGFKRSTGTVDVEVRTLDDVVASNALTPHIVKIDAETYEPHVLAGARSTIARHRPTLVVEVLPRPELALGEAIERAIDEHGYRFHDISPTASWEPRASIEPSAEAGCDDWLLSPEPLPDDFGKRFQRWQRALASCTPDRTVTAAPAAGRGDRVGPSLAGDGLVGRLRRALRGRGAPR
jgi:FkbM family methyltransferase